MPQDLYASQQFQGAVLLPTAAPDAADLVNGAIWLDTAVDPDRFIGRAGGANTDLAANGGWSPTEQGYKAWTGDPTDFATSTQNMTSGTMYICRIPVSRSISVSAIDYWISTLGATLTANRNAVGLYNAAGALISSVDQTAAGASGGNGQKTAAIGPITLTGGVGAFVYGAMMWTGTTLPLIMRKAALSALSANVNLTSTTAGYRSASAAIASGGLPATLPATGGANVLFWMGLR